jgi:hypothetical protein
MANDEVGHDWWLYIDSVAMEGITDISFSDSFTTIDTTARNNGGDNKTYSLGLRDFSLTGSVIAGSDGFAAIKELWTPTITQAVFMLKSQATGGDSFSFPGIISEFSITPPVNGLAVANFKVVNQGDLTVAQ